MSGTSVVLKVCKEYKCEILREVIKGGLDELGGLENFIKPKSKVLIKTDLYHSTRPNIAKTTHPNIVSVLAEFIEDIGAQCIIADSPKGDFKQSNLDNAYDKTQMLQASNNGNATLNANDNIAIIHNPKGENCRDIYVMDAINDVDIIINVAKLRCDKYLGLSGCSLNVFGFVPGKFKELVKSRCYTTKSFYNYIIDLNETLEDKLVLNILDAIVGNETNDDPRILNSILIAENPYAVDSVALRLINQNPKDSILMQEAERRQKVKLPCNIVGSNIDELICSDFNFDVDSVNIKKGSKSALKRDYNRRQKRPIIPSGQCKGCRVCVNNCPMKAIDIKNSSIGEYSEINYDKCITCLKCVNVCPYKIIKIKEPIKYSAINKMIKKSLRNNK
ncbi:MAG: DUF362 domain-containing protein [Clostridia bacterium]